MVRPARSRFALVVCTLVLGLGFGHVETAAASGEPDPGFAAQTSSNSASASSVNDSSTSQTSKQTQSARGPGSGQSQSAVQTASTEQSAQASASSTQGATNVSPAGKKAEQRNSNTASSTASNTDAVHQHSSQAQSGAGGEQADTAAGSGQSQKVKQSAPTKQAAAATATSTQASPANVNIVVRVDSPGDDGPVTQTNSSQANATAGNASHVVQSADQTQTGGRSGAGQAQLAEQTAPTTQQATANAVSAQVNPLNLNIVIRNKSPGDEGPVTQTNASRAAAGAANANAVAQRSTQLQRGRGSARAQFQLASQAAPTSQSGNASAASTQTRTTSPGISVAVDPAAVDPNGSGALGTSVRIWIPHTYGASAAMRLKRSVANANASNANAVTQATEQAQHAAPPGGPTHLGGSAQIQLVNQSAPAVQVATAIAISKQWGAASGASSSTARTGHDVTQSAVQIQDGRNGGARTQAIQQSAPATQAAGAISPATALGSTALRTNTNDVVQGAEQEELGGWSLAPRAATFSEAQPVASAGRGRTAGGAASPPARHRRGAAPPPNHGFPLPPRAPAALGADAGGGSGGALSLFVLLSIQFVLTAPWWARRHRPSAVRRLMGVVFRLERPG